MKIQTIQKASIYEGPKRSGQIATPAKSAMMNIAGVNFQSLEPANQAECDFINQACDEIEQLGAAPLSRRSLGGDG